MTSGKKAKAGSKSDKSKARSLKSLSAKASSDVRGGGKAQGGPILAGWDLKANKKV
jgi:hypothetical protein